MLGSENFDFDKECIVPKPLSESYANPMAGPGGYGHDRYNFGFEYQILPFNTLLQMKGNDREQQRKFKDVYSSMIYVGDEVYGYSPRDKKKHRGRVIAVTYRSDGVGIRYVWVVDEKDHDRYPLVFKKTSIVNSSNTANRIDLYSKVFSRANLRESENSFCVTANGYELSSGVVAEKKFNTLVESDELYREILISKLHMKPEQIKYFDLKFYTEFYTANSIFPKEYRTRFFGNAIGIPSDNMEKGINKKAFWYFIDCYCVYTKNYEHEKLTVDYGYYESRIMRTSYTGNPLEIQCWKDIYYIMQCVQKTYKYIESVGNDGVVLDSTDEDEDKRWINHNAESKEHYEYVRKFIISLLVTQHQEQKVISITSDGHKKFETTDENVPMNSKGIIY